MTTTKLSSELRRLWRVSEYVLATVGSVLGYVAVGTDGAILGAVLGFFAGKTVQSLLRTLQNQ